MADKKDNQQVTVIVRHNVRPGKEAVFEDWLAGISEACQSFKGFIGTETIKPMDTKKPHYVCIFRFDNFLNLEQWMESSDRSEWLAKSNQFSDIEPQYEHYQHHGMDVLLGNSKSNAKNNTFTW